MMENIWVYTIEGQSCGIVIAETGKEALQKVQEAYKKHGYADSSEEFNIYNATRQDGWFADSPDVLEIISK